MCFISWFLLFYFIYQLPVTVIKEGWRVCGSCMRSVIESADVPPLLLYSPIATGSSPPPAPTIVYATQYKHMLELVICIRYWAVSWQVTSSPYSPISTCSCLLPLLSTVINNTWVFTWVTDRWGVGGWGICLPFHCDSGLKCCAQDCQMTHVFGEIFTNDLFCSIGFYSSGRGQMTRYRCHPGNEPQVWPVSSCPEL